MELAEFDPKKCNHEICSKNVIEVKNRHGTIQITCLHFLSLNKSSKSYIFFYCSLLPTHCIHVILIQCSAAVSHPYCDIITASLNVKHREVSLNDAEVLALVIKVCTVALDAAS